MEVFFWVLLVVEFLWLLFETKGMQLRLLTGKAIPKPAIEAITEILPILIAVAFVCMLVTQKILLPRPWYARLGVFCCNLLSKKQQSNKGGVNG